LPDETKETYAREYRKDSEITRIETVGWCSLALVVAGFIALPFADPANVHLIGGGYAAIVVGAIGCGALRGHARLMDREQRHHEQVLWLLERLGTLIIEHDEQTLKELYNTGPRRDVLARLERIERRQQREIDALNGALDPDDIEAWRRRNNRLPTARPL
jgi:cobalt uptake protein with substrate-specific transmembrane region